MNILERAALTALHRMDPEKAHSLSLSALRSGLVPLPGPVTSPRLATVVGGLVLPNPVGLAAGYDKNAVALAALMRAASAFSKWARPRPGRSPAIRSRGSSG